MLPAALLVTHSDKSIAIFQELLRSAAVEDTLVTPSCQEARRLVAERDFELCIINAPLMEESGEMLACDIARKSLVQVILLVKAEVYDAVTFSVEDDGVLTVSKPFNRTILWSAIKMAKAMHNKMQRMQTENTKLVQKIDDIKLVDRAKCVLIAYLHLSEQEAHKYIERQAMDLRTTKRKVAQDILRIYES